MLNKRDGPCEGSSFVDSREGLNIGEKALCCSDEGQSKRFPVNIGGKLVMISEESNLTISAEGNLPDSHLPQC